MSQCNALEALKVTDCRLDQPSQFVGFLVVANSDDPVLYTRNDRFDAAVEQRSPESVGTMSLVKE